MWNKFHGLDRMIMANKIFHNNQAGLWGEPSQCLTVQSRPTDKHFAVNFFEDEKKVSVQALLAGVSKENIDVNIEGNILTIKALRSISECEGYRVCTKQRPTFEAERKFRLPTDVDKDAVEANFKAGVLSLEIAKVKSVQPKKIVIN
ncbi:MAG: Hsp20/alpha crystallin family protein [Desulfotalea sp.]